MRINLCSPKTIINGKNYTFDVIYEDSESFTIQLPRCQLISGMYESDGKCYCEIAIPTGGVTNELYFNIASRIEYLLKKEKRYENVLFLGHMRKVIDDFSCLRLKMPQNRSTVITDVVYMKDGEEQPLTIGKLIKGCTVIPIVSIDHAYVINETLGFNMLLKKVVVMG